MGSKQNTSGFAGRPWAQPVSLERHGQRNHKNSTNQIYEERQTIIHCSYTYMRPANQSRPQTVQWLMPDCTLHFSLPKGGPKPDLDPRPPDLHQNVRNIIANTPGKLLAPEGSFWKSIFWQGFPPCPPGHLPPQTEYAGVLS